MAARPKRSTKGQTGERKPSKRSKRLGGTKSKESLALPTLQPCLASLTGGGWMNIRTINVQLLCKAYKPSDQSVYTTAAHDGSYFINVQISPSCFEQFKTDFVESGTVLQLTGYRLLRRNFGTLQASKWRYVLLVHSGASLKRLDLCSISKDAKMLPFLPILTPKKSAAVAARFTGNITERPLVASTADILTGVEAYTRRAQPASVAAVDDNSAAGDHDTGTPPHRVDSVPAQPPLPHTTNPATAAANKSQRLRHVRRCGPILPKLALCDGEVPVQSSDAIDTKQDA
eukprot:TRINITY_DN12266_c0_g1_i1.p1 TRINITY_DN12266_c0_g1~~TRINITY_DN12266_c0_g1_i1.p1  ORF type:complete len:295 (+),score=15.27 TRINITY_DN12266_c0_g1_i1:26-886(+)